MRASVFEQAGRCGPFDSRFGKGSCWAIAVASGVKGGEYLDDARERIPELKLWDDMHKPELAGDNDWWLQDTNWGDYSPAADEIRQVLLLEAALNLREQGYDES